MIQPVGLSKSALCFCCVRTSSPRPRRLLASSDSVNGPNGKGQAYLPTAAVRAGLRTRRGLGKYPGGTLLPSLQTLRAPFPPPAQGRRAEADEAVTAAGLGGPVCAMDGLQVPGSYHWNVTRSPAKR